MNAKTKNIVSWVISGLLALLFLFAGSGKLMNDPTTVANFEKWGFSGSFMMIIGVLEVLGGIGLLIPKLRLLAALGLVGIMLGAVGTHVMNGEFSEPMFFVSIIALVLLLVLAFVLKPNRVASPSV